METELNEDKLRAMQRLEQGLAEEYGDYLAEVIVNLDDGTCDYVELCPALRQVAEKDIFHYFDNEGADNADSEPKPDPNRKVSFRRLAEKSILNIQQNAGFPSHTLTHRLLKSNNTQLIKSTLEQLLIKGSTDQSLIPILEKIVLKNTYRSYKMFWGLKVDCPLGQRARNVMEMIQHPERTSNKVLRMSDGTCGVCRSLPEKTRVNYGREERYPDAYYELVKISEDPNIDFKCCPECRTYFSCVDHPQEYGSGDNAEFTIDRFTENQSRHLDNLYTANELYHPSHREVQDCFKELPDYEIGSPLKKFRTHQPEVFINFIPGLIEQITIRNNKYVSDIVMDYVSSDRERAEAVLRWFSIRNKSNLHIIEILQHCLKLVFQKPS